ncbi:RNA helicase [Thermodesulfomicrobium sp. WS]|uniref:DEAD/DEAH box helicase n=1 Tax=Thermodesulfomicrobium sp. WS TaxID=3004129 RepID=UPI00248FCBF9|nr:DEAD/DEAH box helicase [Thermodesulfomicrobium sp. WS]BDV00776.1 RNA helicase [Thermodesulfomicrobium sp. WS]
MPTFADLGLCDAVLTAVLRKGFEEPTPIQAQTIPTILNDTRDVLAQAQTGTGKTAAYGIPILQLLDPAAPHVQALILTPTRELAIQVAEELSSLRPDPRITIAPIYGGQSMGLQLRALRRGVSIVAGTPGRILDHLRRESLDLAQLAFAVLDEADEMMSMGFLDDVEEILSHTPAAKRTLLFSATMPREILAVARRTMNEFVTLRAESTSLTASATDQIAFEVAAADKFEALCRIIDMEEDFYGLVFCRTKVDADAIASRLEERGYDARALHGDLGQAQREKILDAFKKRHARILVATDVAARGIDVQDLTHVINFDLPGDPEAYVHRVGRTGRAGKSGIAITFVTPSEYRRLQWIQKLARTSIRKGKLPKVAEVLEAKRSRIESEVRSAMDQDIDPQMRHMAARILAHSDPETALAAVLQHAFGTELDPGRYRELQELGPDRTGKTRLVVSQGRRDGLTPRRLVAYLSDACGVEPRRVGDIEILDTCAFVSLPFADAEKVLAHRSQEGQVLFRKARPRPRAPFAKSSPRPGPRHPNR